MSVGEECNLTRDLPCKKFLSDPASANFSFYYSPPALSYGDDFTFWGEITWPRKFKGGYFKETIWRNGEALFKGTRTRGCDIDMNREDAPMDYPLWTHICAAIAGDYIRLAKREHPLIMKHYKRRIPQELFDTGQFRLRYDVYDNADESFACLEVDIMLIRK